MNNHVLGDHHEGVADLVDGCLQAIVVCLGLEVVVLERLLFLVTCISLMMLLTVE